MSKRKQTHKNKHRKVAKRTRKHKGGKYISEGTYGCGYFPALRCEGETERMPGVFSKIMDSMSAVDENRIGKWFKEVDPTYQYFIYPLKMCKINKKVLPNPENNLNTCKDKYESLDDSMILQYYNGGSAINSLELSPADYYPFFVGFNNLFEGLIKLHQHGIGHIDIKAPNVVGQKDTPNTFHLRFIDFGLSINTLTKNYPINENVYLSPYSVWPFEIRFLSGNFSVERFLNIENIRIFNSGLNTAIWVPKDVYKFLSVSSFMNIYNRFKAIEDKKKVSFITQKTDVYSFGSLIAYIYYTKVGHYYSESEKYITDKKLKMNSVKDKVERSVYAWHEEVFKNISIPLYTLVNKMMNLDPFLRCGLAEAMKEYKEILPAMERLFTEEFMRKNILEFRISPKPLYPPSPIVVSEPVEEKRILPPLFKEKSRTMPYGSPLPDDIRKRRRITNNNNNQSRTKNNISQKRRNVS